MTSADVARTVLFGFRPGTKRKYMATSSDTM
jgi:hypothetical protein